MNVYACIYEESIIVAITVHFFINILQHKIQHMYSNNCNKTANIARVLLILPVFYYNYYYTTAIYCNVDSLENV